jgi:hypothetical protein
MAALSSELPCGETHSAANAIGDFFSAKASIGPRRLCAQTSGDEDRRTPDPDSLPTLIAAIQHAPLVAIEPDNRSGRGGSTELREAKDRYSGREDSPAAAEHS